MYTLPINKDGTVAVVAAVIVVVAVVISAAVIVAVGSGPNNRKGY